MKDAEIKPELKPPNPETKIPWIAIWCTLGWVLSLWGTFLWLNSRQPQPSWVTVDLQGLVRDVIAGEGFQELSDNALKKKVEETITQCQEAIRRYALANRVKVMSRGMPLGFPKGSPQSPPPDITEALRRVGCSL
jgi:hypothetical protein